MVVSTVSRLTVPEIAATGTKRPPNQPVNIYAASRFLKSRRREPHPIDNLLRGLGRLTVPEIAATGTRGGYVSASRNSPPHGS